jgi:glycosyltransferase involved in cell wall biosynthesis
MMATSPNRVPVLLMVRGLGIGGTERQLVETARFLERDRFIPHVACFRPHGLRRADLDNAGIPVLHLPLYSFKSPALFRAAKQLIRYISDHQIKVVHSFDAPSNIFAVPVARYAGVPAVLSSQRGDRDLTGQLIKRCLRLIDRLTGAVVVNCLAMQRYLVEDEGVPESKIRVCYNAVDIEQYKRRASISPWPGKLVIGVVCALRPEKGLDTLIRAFAKLSKSEVVLAIVGSGPEEPNLRSLASELGVVERCHFQAASSDVAEWLSRMDLFVLPSRSEALSNALMEAMACSCCSIATRVGGNPELIDDEEDGLLFEVDNVDELARQIESLLADPARRQTLAAAASAKMATRFSYSQAAATMRQIYESALLDAQRKRRRMAKSSG